MIIFVFNKIIDFFSYKNVNSIMSLLYKIVKNLKYSVLKAVNYLNTNISFKAFALHFKDY